MPSEPPRLRNMLKSAEPRLLGPREAAGGQQRERDDDEGLAERADELRQPELRPRRVAGSYSAFITQLTPKSRKPKADQQPRIHPLHDHRHEREDEELWQPRPHHHLADLQRVVALDLAEIDRQQVDRAVERQSPSPAQAGRRRRMPAARGGGD